MSIPKSDPFLGKVRRTIKKYSLLSPEDRVLVAVSGGPDSVCLLSALHALAGALDLTLHVAHLDHMFRGEESANEARFVARLAEKLGIPSTIEKLDVPAFCRARGVSPQAGARETRYAFLSEVARATGASRIATGHTATDQAETFLMRILRGAGVSGLAAIPPKRDDVIRPLLEVTREEVLDYLRSNDLPFMSDSSNAKPLYTRNRIRMDVLPVLKRFNPRIIKALASAASLLRDEDEAMETHSAALASEILSREKDAVVLRKTEFNALQPALRRRLFRKTAALAGADPSGLSSVQIDEALAFMTEARTGRTMLLPRGLTIEREYGAFVINRAAPAEAFCHGVTVPGLTAVPELGLEVEFTLPAGAKNNGKTNYLWQAAFDYDKLMPHLTFRNRRPGDWFCPSGMEGRHKKLQDFLVDEKIPRRRRDRVPLLLAGENILWVVGLRTDERFLAREGTKNILVVTVRKFNGEMHDP
jgi:tRNA(Ile)-lysidine synthase